MKAVFVDRRDFTGPIYDQIEKASRKERIATLKLTEPTRKNILVLCENLKSDDAFGLFGKVI